MENLEFLKENQKIVWMGWFWEHSGYALMNRHYARGLKERGWDVGIECIPSPIEISKEEFKYFNDLRKFRLESNKIVQDLYLDPDVVKVIGWIPVKGVPAFRKNIIYTMMESRGVGDFFVRVCNENYNLSWTPTEYYKNQMIESGIKIPVEVMPIGVDEIYNKKNVKEEIDLNYKIFSKYSSYPEKPEGFKFLSVFRWNYRKGPDVLIKAFLRAFKRKDDVSLVILSKHAAASREQRFMDAVEGEIAQLVEENATVDSPPIYWSADNIKREDMPTAYNIGDCFALPSRGDGLCLPALEASRMELPTILPHHTGFSDYVTEKTSYTFDVDDYEVCNDNPKWGEWITRIYNGQEFPIFGESVINNVVDLMREVKNNDKKSSEKVKEMNKVIDQKYTWEKCLEKAENCFRDIL